MEYTICSRGQPIGTTDLGYFRTDDRNRFGNFHPNAAGEPVMPIFAAPLRALRACVERGSEPPMSPYDAKFRDSPLVKAYFSALEELTALELTLHTPDGSLVRTEMIGIRDTEQLLELARTDLERHELERGDAEGDDSDGVDPDGLYGRFGLAGFQLAEEDDGEIDDFEMELFEVDRGSGDYARYQVHVLLAEGVTLCEPADRQSSSS